MRHPLMALVALMLVAAMLAAAGGCRRQAAWKSPEQKPGQGQAELPKVTIEVGGTSLEVEAADTDESRQMGYMYREKPEKSGMLFVYPAEQMMSFIMRNVKFDIDIAFITADGRLEQIEHMKAFMGGSWDSLRPAQYALEVPAGWFAEHRVAAGAQVKIPGEVPVKAKAVAEAAKKAEDEKKAAENGKKQ